MATPTENLMHNMNGKKSLNELKDSFANTEHGAEEMASDLRDSATAAGKKAKEYANTAVGFAKENPLYVALGVLGAGVIVGFIARRLRK